MPRCFADLDQGREQQPEHDINEKRWTFNRKTSQSVLNFTQSLTNQKNPLPGAPYPSFLPLKVLTCIPSGSLELLSISSVLLGGVASINKFLSSLQQFSVRFLASFFFFNWFALHWVDDLSFDSFTRTERHERGTHHEGKSKKTEGAWDASDIIWSIS